MNLLALVPSDARCALSSCDPDRPSDDDERYAWSCFDSSLDLRAGLSVTEHASLADLMQALSAPPPQ